MNEMEIRGRWIDVYEVLRNIAQQNPGMTLDYFIRKKELEAKEQEQIAEIVRSINKR